MELASDAGYPLGTSILPSYQAFSPNTVPNADLLTGAGVEWTKKPAPYSCSTCGKPYDRLAWLKRHVESECGRKRTCLKDGKKSKKVHETKQMNVDETAGLSQAAHDGSLNPTPISQISKIGKRRSSSVNHCGSSSETQRQNKENGE